MPYRFSLVVNGRSLGPYERRMIVGMRVKNIISDEQIVVRDDGIQMQVVQLLGSRDEAPSHTAGAQQQPTEISTSNFSVGMWPQFNVRFGGGPIRSGALGFSGLGQVTYLGGELLFKGNRRNHNLGMSRHEERLAIHAIHSATPDSCFANIGLKAGQEHNPGDQPIFIRIECTTAHEAQELCGLLNMPRDQFLSEETFAQTAANILL